MQSKNSNGGEKFPNPVKQHMATLRQHDRMRIKAADTLEPHDFRTQHHPLPPDPMNAKQVAIAKRDPAVVEQTEKTMLDSKGRIGSPMITADTLAIMLSRKTITGEMYAAGKHFEVDFAKAHLDPLRAADMGRLPGGGTEPEINEGKRNAVHRAIQVLGGRHAPPACAAWAILGEGKTVKEYAVTTIFGRGRSLRPDVASGLLIAALSILAVHYGYERPGPDYHSNT